MENQLCKRGVLYVTELCNHRCKFCYYRYIHRDKHEDILRIKQLADFEKFTHNLTHVDITGIGEPTLHPKIKEIIKYCKEIELLPAMITNGSLPDRVEEIIKEGYIEDIVLSVHSMNKAYNELTGGNYNHLIKTMKILKKYKFNWRSNVTVIKENLKYLPEMVKLTKKYGGRLINFLVFNPHDGTDLASKENECQATYTQCAEAIKKAIDVAEKIGVLVEVRYIPLCTMKGYEKYVLNFHQWIYDPYSWEEGHANGRLFKTNEDAEKFIKEKTSVNWQHDCPTCNLCTFAPYCDGIYPQYKKKYGTKEFVGFTQPIDEIMFFRKIYMQENPEAYSEDKW